MHDDILFNSSRHYNISHYINRIMTKFTRIDMIVVLGLKKTKRLISIINRIPNVGTTNVQHYELVQHYKSSKPALSLQYLKSYNSTKLLDYLTTRTTNTMLRQIARDTATRSIIEINQILKLISTVIAEKEIDDLKSKSVKELKKEMTQ